LLEGHEQAFDYIGGVFRTLKLYWRVVSYCVGGKSVLHRLRSTNWITWGSFASTVIRIPVPSPIGVALKFAWMKACTVAGEDPNCLVRPVTEKVIMTFRGAFAGATHDAESMHPRPGSYNIEIREAGQTRYAERVFVVPGRTLHLHPQL
jgi:hypothetical protein